VIGEGGRVPISRSLRGVGAPWAAWAPWAAVDLPESEQSPDRIRRVVDEVLSRPEFADAQPSLLARVLGWLGEQLTRFLSVLAGNELGQVAFALVLAVAVAVIVAGLMVFGRRIRRSGGAPGEATVGSGGRSGDEWRSLAEEAESVGDHRTATRCRYRGLVADFAGAGWLEEIPGRTSGQYRRTVERHVPAAGEAFARATEVFERTWYGRVRSTGEDVRAVERAAGEALEAARGRVRAGA
jgi:hypothetical protein